MAESIIVREEAASERAFDPRFRARVKKALAGLPLAVLESQEGGLGLNALGDSQADLVYTPVPPCRIIDTRLAGGTLSPGVPRSFKVTGDTTSQGGANCGIPFGPATSAMINFVAISPAGKRNMQITPFRKPMPQASFINYSNTAGTNLANGLAVALCNPSAATCAKDVTIQANNSGVDLVADVQGYFQRVSTGGVGTALLADSAVTAPKVANGTVVRSLNGQTDTVTVAGTNGLGVTQGSGTVTVASDATPTNAAGAIVSRDGLGNFWAGSIGLAGNLSLPNTSGPFVGVLTLGGAPFLHNYGTDNTFVGASAGNTSLTGGRNTGTGANALTANTTGAGNTAFGSTALKANTTGNYNTATGVGALQANTTASYNSAFGYQALLANTIGVGNTAFGYSALYTNTQGYYNTATGVGALQANTTASYNSAFGYQALMTNTGASNSAFGYYAMRANSGGDYNSAFGYQALTANTTGDANAAFGLGALQANTTGASNTAFGDYALLNNTTGSYNIAVGNSAGIANVSGDNNIYIGSGAAGTESGFIRIGNGNFATATYIAGIYNSPSPTGVAAYVNGSGRLGSTTSSRRYKDQIVDMDAESDALMRLRPVAFYYKPEIDDTHTRQYGLVAEEVAEIAPELVLNDESGAPQAVRYHFVNAMLLNEVQKQRRLVEEQKATIVLQESRIGEEESKIQALETRLAKLEAALAGDR